MVAQRIVLGFAVCLASCSAPMGEASLTIQVLPQTVLPGQEARIEVVATAADGSLGTGTVKVSSDQGSLVDGVEVTLDKFGTATTPFVCPAPCTSPITLTARWNVVSAKTNLALTSGGGPVETCEVGTVTSLATSGSLDLFGTVLYFENGAALPAGNYRIKNTGGCLKYGPGQNWCVNAYLDGTVDYWVVGATTDIRYFMPPGTFGFTANNMDVGFATFAECDAANRALPAKDFNFVGGKMGVWLKDLIYQDNTAGEGRNPSWSLSKVNSNCP